VAAAIAVLVAAEVLGRRDLLHLAVFLALVPAAAWAANLLFRPSLDVRREPRPDVVEAGRATEVSLSLAHSGLLSGRMSMAEQLPPSLGAGPGFLYPGRSVGADGRSHYRYELAGPRRGLYLLGPVEARHTDPFGLAERRSRIGTPTRLVVTPRAVPLSAAVLSGLRGTEGLVAAKIQSMPSDDDIMTREYRPGDPMRRVHWAATARQGELMVRQEESATSPEATVVLDLRRSAFPRPGSAGHDPADRPDTPAFEWAVTAAMSVCAHLAALNYTVRLLAPDGSLALARSPSAPEPESPEYAGSTGLAAVAESLAAIAPREAVAGTGEGFSDLLLDRLEGHRGRGPVIAILGRTTAGAASGLAPAAAWAERALAVVVVPAAGSGRDAVEALRGGGWSAVEATPRASVAAAWAALTGEAAEAEAGRR
jgi:uncharacterized protein (DUF58 family)